MLFLVLDGAMAVDFGAPQSAPPPPSLSQSQKKLFFQWDYLERLGLRLIGRFLKFSNVVIFNWIKETFGWQSSISETTHPFRLWNRTKCIVMLVIKNYCWIWFAVDRDGKRFIDSNIGHPQNCHRRKALAEPRV